MPELPEVETIVRHLHSALHGRQIREVVVARPDVVRAAPRPLEALLPSRVIGGVTRRAKRILCDLGGDTLVFHLGMSGRLVLCPPDHPLEPHTHLRLRFADLEDELRFRDPRRFGGVWYLAGRDAGPAPRLGPIGPEPLELSPREFHDLLAGRRRHIKALLMDQHVIAGLGNIYVDEALFDARIHPQRRANTLSREQSRLLLKAIQRVLRRAIRWNGSTLTDYRRADGWEGDFQRLHRVFRKTGKPCPRCGATIRRLVVAGRSTHVCPKCQRAGTRRKR